MPYTLRVPVAREKVETYKVPAMDWKPVVQTYTVRVPTTRPEVVTRWVPVTTWRTIAEVIVERVPHTVCVKVPCPVQVCVLVAGPK